MKRVVEIMGERVELDGDWPGPVYVADKAEAQMIDTQIACEVIDQWNGPGPTQYRDEDVRWWYRKLLDEVEQLKMFLGDKTIIAIDWGPGPAASIIANRTSDDVTHILASLPDDAARILSNVLFVNDLKIKQRDDMIKWLFDFYEWLQSNPSAKGPEDVDQRSEGVDGETQMTDTNTTRIREPERRVEGQAKENERLRYCISRLINFLPCQCLHRKDECRWCSARVMARAALEGK